MTLLPQATAMKIESSLICEMWNNNTDNVSSTRRLNSLVFGLPWPSATATRNKEAQVSDLILMVRLFVGIFYPKATEALQHHSDLTA
jgi:hypothetical protein